MTAHAEAAHDNHDDAAHDHADEHAVDSDALEPGEPHSPVWLPFLGIGLFLAALLVFLAVREAPEPSETTGATDTASAAQNPDNHAGHDHPPGHDHPH